MESTPRFKIDFNPGYSSYSAFALFFRRKRWCGAKWERVDTFESVAKATAHYETIKDLPEYLP